MIQKEFKEIVFEFAKRLSDLPNIKHIFLFGSVARGEADKRSDIDFCVIINNNDKKRISKVALDLEKKCDKNIQLVISKNFSKLDNYFINKIFEEGILLYSKEPLIKVRNIKCMEFLLISYSLKNLTQKDKMKIKTKFYGYSTKKRIKKKIYKSLYNGLVNEFGGTRVGAGAILIPLRNAKPILDILNNFKIKYNKIKLLKSIT